MLELLKVSFIMDALGDSLPAVSDISSQEKPCVPAGDCFPVEQGCFPADIPCEPDLICIPTILP
jgi:hypothetical protein